MIIDELAKKYQWETTTEGLIKIKPLSKFEWQTFPVDDTGFIEITEDSFIGLATKLYQFNDTLDGVDPFNFREFKEFITNKKGV